MKSCWVLFLLTQIVWAAPSLDVVVEWDGTNEFGTRISPGVYFCTLKIGSMVKTAKPYILR